MKKLMFVVVLLAMVLALPGVVEAKNQTISYVLDLTTTQVQGNSINDNVVNISSNTDHEIVLIELSNDNWGIQQTVTLWDNISNSSATATKLWEVHLSSGVQAPYQIPFTDRYPLYATDGVQIRKSSADSGVTGNILVK